MLANSSLLGRSRTIAQRLQKFQRKTGEDAYRAWLEEERRSHPRGAARWLAPHGDGDVDGHEAEDVEKWHDRGVEGGVEGEDAGGRRRQEGRGGEEACSANELSVSDGEEERMDGEIQGWERVEDRASPLGWEELRGGGQAFAPIPWEEEQKAARADVSCASPFDASLDPDSDMRHTGLSPILARRIARLEKALVVQRLLSDFLSSSEDVAKVVPCHV